MDIKIGDLHRRVALWPGRLLRTQQEETQTIDKQKRADSRAVAGLVRKSNRLFIYNRRKFSTIPI